MKKFFSAGLAAFAFALAQPALSASILDDANIYTRGDLSLAGSGNYGSIAAGGDYTKAGSAHASPSGLAKSEVLDAMNYASGLSAYYAGSGTNASIVGTKLIGIAGINVINISGSELQLLSSFEANGATRLVLNVTGDFSLNGSGSFLGLASSGLSADEVLINFIGDSTVTLRGSRSYRASMLAPDSFVDVAGSLTISGAVYADSFKGGGSAKIGGTLFADLGIVPPVSDFDDQSGNEDQPGYEDPNGSVLVSDAGDSSISVPEPGVWTLMLLGLGIGGIGIAARRRQQHLQFS